MQSMVRCLMTPQIIGSRKSAAYRRCERYFKDRRIAFQGRDLNQNPLSPTELDRIADACGGYQALLDENSKEYIRRGMAWMEVDPREELLENPLLLRTPIVRTDGGISIDPDDTTLKELLG